MLSVVRWEHIDLECLWYTHKQYYSHVCCINTLFFCVHFHSDLPLTVDIEGPPVNSSSRFVLGARVISNNQYDLFFEGQLAGVVLLPSVAPSGFSQCVLSCLEDLTADTSGTGIYSTGFDKSQRHIELVGLAPPSEYQAVIAAMVYSNRAPNPNINNFLVILDDGSNIHTMYMPVSFDTNKRRRRSIRHGFKRRRLLSAEQGGDIILDREMEPGGHVTREEGAGNSKVQPTHHFIPLMVMTLVSIVGLGTILVAAIWWKKRRAANPTPVSWDIGSHFLLQCLATEFWIPTNALVKLLLSTYN